MTQNRDFDTERIVAFWVTEADEALAVAAHLIEKGDYSYALFFGHLAIEKLLKARYVAHNGEHAPFSHNLLRLAKNTGLALDEARTEALITITAFNIEARYPDMKRAFREKCTAEYTEKEMAKIEELFQWLNSHLQ